MRTSNVKMKKLVLAAVLILSLGVTACGNANTETSGDPSNVTTVMDEGTSITEAAGSNIGEMPISDIPDEYKTQAERQGEVVRLDYDTSNGSKYAYVYIPFGYSEDEKYDILYLMHGGGGSAESVFGSLGSNSEMKNVVDHLIENGELNPLLIVTPTFYTSVNSSSSVDGSWDAVREFPDELTNKLMPAVESTYSTYADTTDESGFTASREHRAFGGFSMGAVTTWYIFEEDLAYFSKFIPISGDSWTVEMQGGRSKADETAAKLAQSVPEQGYTENDFSIYAITGSDDIAEPMMTAQTDAMKNESVFDFSQSGNITYRVREGGVHDMNYVKMYLYNVLPELWPGERTKSAESVELKETSYHTEEIRCTNEGEDIYGVAYIPDIDDEKYPLVIFSHELGNTHTSGTDYAEKLAAQGIAAYTFDYRNGSSASRSGNDMSKMSVMTEVSDLEAVINAAKTWDFVDADKIVLIGGSQGGFVTAATAAKHTDEIAGVVLLYPAFVIVDDVHEMFSSLNDIPDTFSYRGWFTAGRLYAADVWDYDIYNEISAYDKPVLILHGDRDYMVESSYSERAAESYVDAEYHIIQGAGHGFYGASFDEAFSYIEEYLTRIGIR